MATQTEIFLTDIAFDDDLKATASGNLDVVSGIRNLQGALLRRLITTPGSLAHRPNYGVGLLNFQGAAMTINTQRQISLKIVDQFQQDPRVDVVTSVIIETQDLEPDKITITVKCKIVGIGEQEFVFTPFDGTV